jgi:hypothetical protein
MRREVQHVRGVLASGLSTVRDLPLPPAQWTPAGRARYLQEIMRRVDLYHRLAAQEIASGVVVGVRDAADRVLTSLGKPDRLDGAILTTLGKLGGTENLIPLYETHLQQRRGIIANAAATFLAKAELYGLTARQTRSDASRLFAGFFPEHLSLKQLSVAEMSGFRTLNSRIILLAVTEIHDVTRDASMEAQFLGGVIGGTWTLSAFHPASDECDDLAGRQFRYDVWPMTHPRCGCRAGPPFLFAA